MTDAERERLRDEGRLMMRHARAEQGLPPHVTDLATLQAVARIALRAKRDADAARVEPAPAAGSGSDGDVVDDQPQ